MRSSQGIRIISSGGLRAIALHQIAVKRAIFRSKFISGWLSNMFSKKWLLLVCLATVGCNKPGANNLDILQAAAQKHQTCLTQRTFRDECVATQEALDIARLTVVKAGTEERQIDAATQLGVLSVHEKIENSPYDSFMARRKEVIASNLIHVSPEVLAEDEALARTMKAAQNNDQPLTRRQQAENALVQVMLEEKYPGYFSEPANGIETDREILNMVCKAGTRADLSEACKRFKRH